jgi:muconate cycloisomerase
MFDAKIGMHGEAGDLELVRRTRRAAGERSLQVDANRGYKVDAALRQARRFADLAVALFEQPLNGFNLSGYRRLQALSPVPIGIDESLRSVPDLLEYVRADAIGVAVAKVQRNAGLYRSRQLCDAAEAAGLELSLSGDGDRRWPRGRPAAPAAFDINPL